MKLSNSVTSILFVIILTFVLGGSTIAQQWADGFPKDKDQRAQLSLFEHQKAFNDYWKPFNVEDGYYMLDGKKEKAGGWKQFKRWEWFWERRVNPITGEFPKVSAMENYKTYLENQSGSRSPSGNWTSMGPSSSSGGYAGIGRINCVGFNPIDNDKFYIGSAAGGIWKTTDGGSNWTAIGDFNDALGVTDIIVLDDGTNETIYMATGDRDHSDTYSVGVLKSTDGGTTWNTTGLSWTQSEYYIINRLLMDPDNSSILYAATNNGVYKTIDDGVNWSMVSTESFKDMEFKPSTSSTLYGSTTWGEIFKSTNSGSTWTEKLSVSGGRRVALAVTANDNTVVYAIIADNSSGLEGIYKSTDSGDNFSEVFSGNTANLLTWACDGDGSGGQGWYDLCIASDPNDADIVFIGGVNTWASTDGGDTWNISNHWSSSCGGQATTVHADKHDLSYQNGTSTLFESNDGGIYKTSNEGDNWTDISNSLVISQMYRLGVAQTVDDDVITGLQDNGTKSYESGVWDDVIGGDGMECAIDYTNANVQYGSLYYGNIKKTTSHWGNYNTIINGGSGEAAWVTPYLIDPNNNQTLYVGFKDVKKSTNQGNNWTTISNWNGSKLQSLTVAPSNSDYIYAATYSTIYRTSNGGTNWIDITSTLPVNNSSITYISVKEDDPSTVWVSISGFNGDGVYKSSNGGNSWTNISTGLPQLPVNCVIQNKLNTEEEEIYAATDVGVYVKIGDNNWTSFFDGLPNVVVNELDIYYDETTPENSLIRAATFGRGLWESDLYSGAPALIVDFVADTLTPTTIDTVHFTDLTSDNPSSWLWQITPNTFTFIEGTGVNTQNPIVIFNEAGFYTVSLTASNDLGSGTETKEDYIEVGVPLPIADFIADSLNPTTNAIVNFTDLSEYEPSTWLWEFDPNTISYMDNTDENSQNPKVKFDEVGMYTVSLTATNDGGESTETKNNYINVSLGLSASITSDPSSLCDGQETQLTAIGEGGTGAYTYIWTAIPADPSLSGQEYIQSPIVTPQITTLYSVEIFDGLEFMLDETEVVVYPLTEIVLGEWPETVCNQYEPDIQLTALPEGGIFTGNVTEDGIFSPETAPMGWNLITYSYENENSCISASVDSIFVDECVGVNDILTKSDIRVYPNPNDGNFKIGSSTEMIKVDIINQMGKAVYEMDCNSKTVNINTKLSKGIYYLRIKFIGGEFLNKEIIIN